MEDTTENKSFVMPISDVVKLLRIPFSIFLLPVFLFALIPVINPDWFNFTLLFILLHFFIYPASNAYNSYMDQDTESIGGLEHPPKAGKETYYISIVLDAIGIFAAYLFSIKLAALLMVYSVISRLYSWRVVRLKKYPWLSLTIVGSIQGGFTFMTANMFFTNDIHLSWFNTPGHLAGIAVSTLLIGAFYPLTQIYQHEQDRKSGDVTASYILGVKGTFVFTGLLFILSVIMMQGFYQSIGREKLFLLNVLFFLPGVIFFLRWAIKCWRDDSEANFKNAMKMNRLSSLLLIAGFILIWFINRY
jgi:1,4-dihydroxy-2-naphthoate polyprenyltransferase